MTLQVGDRVTTYTTNVPYPIDPDKPRPGTVDIVLPDGTVVVNIDGSGPRECHPDTHVIEKLPEEDVAAVSQSDID